MPASNPRTSLRFSLPSLLGILAFKRRPQRSARRPAPLAKADSVSWAQTSWGQKLIKSTTLALALFCSASIALADVKITTRSTAGGQSMASTTYIKGARQRIEGPGFTTIYQCDLKRMIQLNDKTRSYLVTPLESAGGAKSAGQQTPATKAQRGGVITYTTTSTDTGERKDILGMKAKRVKSKLVVEASEGACNSMDMELETDGWYVDIPAGQGCQSAMTSSLPSLDQSGCVDEVRYKTEGVVNTGYPVTATTTIKFNTGGGAPIPPSTSTQEVTDISAAALDQALFEIPAGYKEVKTTQELGSPY